MRRPYWMGKKRGVLILSAFSLVRTPGLHRFQSTGPDCVHRRTIMRMPSQSPYLLEPFQRVNQFGSLWSALVLRCNLHMASGHPSRSDLFVRCDASAQKPSRLANPAPPVCELRFVRVSHLRCACHTRGRRQGQSPRLLTSHDKIRLTPDK